MENDDGMMDGVFFLGGGEMSIWGCNDILKTFFGWTYQLAEALVGWLWCNFPSLHLNRRCYSHHHDIQGYLKLPANFFQTMWSRISPEIWKPLFPFQQDKNHSHPGFHGKSPRPFFFRGSNNSPQEQDGATTGSSMPPLMSTDQEFENHSQMLHKTTSAE